MVDWEAFLVEYFQMFLFGIGLLVSALFLVMILIGALSGILGLFDKT